MVRRIITNVRSDSRKMALLISVAGLCVVFGVYLIFRVSAAGAVVTVEPEKGTLAAGATAITDTTASNGSAVKFAPGSTGGTGVVDATTLAGKFMLGYQGWHQCPTDGSPSPAWRHWFSGTPPSGTLFDYWPDTSELSAAEKCDTGLKLPNGQPAYLFSDYNQQTVVRQMQWLKDNNMDGVMLQRFTSELSDPAMLAERNQVTKNVMAGTSQTGRTFTIMYDISGQNASTLVSTIENDWKSLVDTVGVTKNGRYLNQGGRPLVVIWGFGFSDRPGTPADLNTLLDFFHNNANPAYRATVMGGVNNDWRTNTTWASTLKNFDVISPWTVGRYKMGTSTDQTTVKNWVTSNTAADLTYAKQQNKLYMPVIWPGFSFHNQNTGQALNSYPRWGGNFLWQQAYYSLQAEKTAGMPTMLYGAMLDEVNEGTAFFKQATTSAGWPSGMTMVPLNTDGYTQLSNDWYLKVGGEVDKMTRGDIPLSQTMTITPH
jgi:hypothetical protein